MRVVNRATVTGATTTDPDFAAGLVNATTGEFFANLPQSAAAKLISAGTRVSLDGKGTVNFPRATSAPAFFPWIAESGEIPVASFAVMTGATLGPARKFAILVASSIELFEHSNAETVFSLMLREVAGRTLDGALFDAGAASALRPAGLRAGVAGLTPTTGGGRNAMERDVAQIVGAVAAAGGDPASIVIVASPALAAALLVNNPDLGLQVWTSLALPAGTLIAVDASAFASGFDGGAPDIESGRDAAVHLDTVPLPIGTPGAPPTVASPVVSAFQSGLIITRLLCDVAWTMRAPNLVAWLSGATW